MSATQAHPPLPPAKPDHGFTRKPESALGQFVWRRRMWFESTFVLSMLEPWEKILLLTTLLVLTLLVTTGVLKYLPQHLAFLQRRAVYYLWGHEGDARALRQWLGLAAEGGARVEL